MNHGHGSQVYNQVSAGSTTFPAKILLSIVESSRLEVSQSLDATQHQDALKLRTDQIEPGTLAGANIPGPLRNLLYQLNKAPSAELLERVVEADRDYEGHERVAWIDCSLKKVLRSGQISSDTYIPRYGIDRYFENFGTEATTFEDEGDPSDDYKNLPDYDPDQEPEVYEYSSDVNLEPIDPFCLARECSKSVGQNGLEYTVQAQKWIHVKTYRENTALNTFPPTFQVIPDPPFPDQTLSPYLLVHSIASNSKVSDPSKVTFETMMSHYGFLTMDGDCKGFSVFRLPGLENEANEPKDASTECWLLVQEFDIQKGFEWRSSHWLELKRREAKHWWYKQGWQNNSVAFYRREETNKVPSDDSSTMDEPEGE